MLPLYFDLWKFKVDGFWSKVELRPGFGETTPRSFVLAFSCMLLIGLVCLTEWTFLSASSSEAWLRKAARVCCCRWRLIWLMFGVSFPSAFLTMRFGSLVYALGLKMPSWYFSVLILSIISSHLIPYFTRL